jgi:hypothetical protein
MRSHKFRRKKDQGSVFVLCVPAEKLKELGIADKEHMGHILEMATEFALVLTKATDAFVFDRVGDGMCNHPEALSLGTAIFFEKFLRRRLEEAEQVPLDPGFCIKIVCDFIEEKIDGSGDGSKEPKPTVH